MNLERLKQIIDIYGSRPDRWPADERLVAEKLLQTSTMAQQWQQHAQVLDQLLDQTTEIMPTAGLKARILAEARAISREIDVWQWLAQWLWGTTLTQHLWRPAFTLGLPIFIGLGLGLAVSDQQTQLSESTVITQNEFANILSSDQPDEQHLTEWAKWL